MRLSLIERIIKAKIFIEALLERGGGGGGVHVPHLNFKSCHVAISEGPYVAVGISSTAAPKFPLPR